MTFSPPLLLRRRPPLFLLPFFRIPPSSPHSFSRPILSLLLSSTSSPPDDDSSFREEGREGQKRWGKRSFFSPLPSLLLDPPTVDYKMLIQQTPRPPPFFFTAYATKTTTTTRMEVAAQPDPPSVCFLATHEEWRRRPSRSPLIAFCPSPPSLPLLSGIYLARGESLTVPHSVAVLNGILPLPPFPV